MTGGTGFPTGLPRPSRRAVLASALALAAGSSAASCSTGSSGGQAEPQRVDDGSPLVVVSGADLTSAEGKGVRQSLIDEWNATARTRRGRKGRQARLVELASAEDGQRAELIAALQSGAAAYDVLNLDAVWIPEFAKAGFIQPLDEADVVGDRDFLPQAWEASRWDGTTYAVPFNTDVGLLYYRTDLLRAQRRGTADLTHADSIGDLIEGWPAGQDRPLYTTQLRSYEGLTVNVLETLWSESIEPVDGDGHYQGTRDDLAHGLRVLEERIAVDGKLARSSFEADESAALAEFTESDGGSVLMRGWPYVYALLPAAYGVTPLPGEAALGGQSLAVAATSARAEEAGELIRFLTGAESQRKLLDAGFAPALRAAYGSSARAGTSCEHRTAVERPAGADDERTGAVSDQRPYVDLLWCALEAAHPRPATPYYAEFSQTLRRKVAEMLRDDAVTAGDAADYLHRVLPRALEGKQ